MTETLDTLWRRLDRVERLNNALRLTIRRQESEIGRLQVRHQHDKDAHHAKVMESTIRELQQRYEALESDFAQATQRLSAFQHETFTLRSLVKLSNHSELVDAARSEAERLVLKEEVRTVKKQLLLAQRECEAYRTRCVEACNTADTLGERIQCLQVERDRLGEYVQQLLSETTEAAEAPRERVGEAPERAASDDEETAAELRAKLEDERNRCAALQETIEALCAERGTAPADARPSVSPSSPQPSHKPARATLEKSKRLLGVMRGENILLTKRVTALIAQNKDLLASLATLEEEQVNRRYHTAMAQVTKPVAAQ